MADTLTQLIAKVQAQLQDDGTLFTTTTITAATRQALNDLNQAAPLHAAITLTAIADQLVYELNDYDAAATGMTNLLLEGDNEFDTPLIYDAYVEDARWFFRLRAPQPATETLIAQYIKPHTVSGLDGSSDSTLPDDLNIALINGACYYSALARAAKGIEANNVEPQVAAHWLKLADLWQRIFSASLSSARRQPTARGEPSRSGWNDPQHDPEYP